MNSLKKSLIWFSLIFVCGLPFSFLAFGSDLTNQRNPLYPYNSMLAIQDDFTSGATAAGSIGDLGFNSINGSTSYQASSASRPGILRRDTSAVSGTMAVLHLSPATAFIFTDTHSVTWIARLNTNDANTTVRLGSGVSVSGNPPNDGIYFEKLDADTNWFCITRSGAVQTRTDSTIAVSTSFADFTYVRNSSGVLFFINKTQVCSQSTNVPSAVAGPFNQIINSAAASKTIDIDYFQLLVTGLTR